MRFALRPHADLPAPRLDLTAEAERRGERLALAYQVGGDLAAVRWPADPAPGRTDELWRHTCFEAFVRPPGDTYLELNFAPSGAWATYGFDRYREGMRAAPVAPVTAARVQRGADAVRLEVELDLGGCPALAGRPWRLALTAVIEAHDGALSYWSAAHPPGRPDFHHLDCVVLELPAGLAR